MVSLFYLIMEIDVMINLFIADHLLTCSEQNFRGTDSNTDGVTSKSFSKGVFQNIFLLPRLNGWFAEMSKVQENCFLGLATTGALTHYVHAKERIFMFFLI